MSDLRPLAMGEQIARQLRIEIITGEVDDGTHLAEDALAARFDVSRGPVRDALRQLEVEGLVENRRKRLYAKPLQMEELEELYALRGALEGLAIRNAIEKAGPDDWSATQDAVDRMRAAGVAEDAEAFARADMDFHTSFYRLARNRRLAEAWRTYEKTFAVLLQMSDTPDIPAATQDHQEFLDTVRSGDVAAATARLAAHLSSAKERLRSALDQRPGPTAR